MTRTTEEEKDGAKDAFAGENTRLAAMEERLAAIDWADPIAAKEGAKSFFKDYQWLLKRFRRTLKVADRMDLQLKSALDKEATQRRAVEVANQKLLKTQQELVQAEKLAALGGMVAGIAHEINTPLGIIRTAASTLDGDTRRLSALAEQGKARKSDVFKYFEAAAEATGLLEANSARAAELIQSFKDVAVDRSSDQRRRFALGPYLEEIIHTLRPELKKTALTIQIDCPSNVELDSHPGAISQIVSNLVMNSIRHGFKEQEAGQLLFTVTQDKDHVILVYSDTGCGVAPDIRDTMFDPFVTTKRGKGGSGLGLHILHNLVLGKLGGRISYSDRNGGGVMFEMIFPIAAPNDPPGTE